MRIRIIRKGAGCVYEPGTMLEMRDKRAQHLVNAGFAEYIDVPTRYLSIPSVNNSPVPYMAPPMFIHSCGFVARNQVELDEHTEQCK